MIFEESVYIYLISPPRAGDNVRSILPFLNLLLVSEETPNSQMNKK